MFDKDEEDTTCLYCSASLTEPYIRCVECGEPYVHICLPCFARGVELGTHKNDHAYVFIKNDFPLYEPTWTAEEDLKLLKYLNECGYGNWSDISQKIKSKSRTECERHYNRCYIDIPENPLPEFRDSSINWDTSSRVVYKLSEDPPRPQVDSQVFHIMGGYMAARGDFAIEHDNYAELDIMSMSFNEEESEDEFDRELKVHVLDIYLNCLKDRKKRKQIVRKYGLINLKKVFGNARRYERTIKHWFDGLRCFTRLLSPMEYDKYIESLHYAQELRRDIQKLQECRKNGLTSLRQIKMYYILKQRRDEEQSRKTMLQELLNSLQDDHSCQQWLHKQASLDNKGLPVTFPLPLRRSAPPLDIMGLPGYDRLNDQEKEVCSVIRLVPEAYMEFKSILAAECEKRGSLKLAQARTLIKIDVNKTRKLYDFLIQQGVINKDPV